MVSGQEGRIMFNRFAKVAATALVAGATIGTPLIMAGTASAATPSAGDSAVEYSVKMFGSKFVLDAEKGGDGYQHQPVILWSRSNSDRAEDFTPRNQGTVQDFRNAGLVSAAFNLHYGSLSAQELEYTPDGRGSGLCVGTWSTAPVATNLLRLEPCGVAANTVMVSAGAGTNAAPGVMTILVGAGNNFSHPLSWAWPSFNSAPQDSPRPVLNVQSLWTYSDGSVPDTMAWKYHQGVIGSR
jgi:hypothetical protein